jgi:hypothetical protein
LLPASLSTASLTSPDVRGPLCPGSDVTGPRGSPEAVTQAKRYRGKPFDREESVCLAAPVVRHDGMSSSRLSLLEKW